jgi:hypothetical protein
MAETKYTYAITDFLNDKVSLTALKAEIEQSDILIALKEMTATNSLCYITFKDALSSGGEDILDALVAAHAGVYIEEDQPHMPDGRPIIRADTRPLNTQTYFTTSGDDEGIGDGKELVWDFSNDDDLVPSGSVPSGYKAKEIKLKFNCPVYLKDGAIYFFDAPWGQHMYMDIMVPSGSYYPNPEGQIPAAMLGLPGDDMYAQAPSGSDVLFQRYVNNHKTYGDCPMGDELNAEGAAVDALPVGWFLRGLIITPEDDDTSKGYASMEMYRCHTVLLPGQDLEDIH